MIKALEELVNELSKLPAIGKKSAWRLAVHLLERNDEDVDKLARVIGDIKNRVHFCEECFGYSEDELCTICSNINRDKSLICIVEKAMDVFTFERSGGYKGVYHVLGGVISPINGMTPDKLNIEELIQRVEKHKPNEIIIGLGGSSESETTAVYLSRILSDKNIKVTRLARGLPAGMDLEYVDQLTLSRALSERTGL